jgi:hypothetical protein
MARTYYESQDKPTYAIRDVLETPDAAPPALAAPAERAQEIIARR